MRVCDLGIDLRSVKGVHTRSHGNGCIGAAGRATRNPRPWGAAGVEKGGAACERRPMMLRLKHAGLLGVGWELTEWVVKYCMSWVVDF